MMNEKMRELSDESLVKEAQRGNGDAFMELARRYQKQVFYTIFGFTRNSLDADDLTQEAFMRAYRSIKGFKKKSGFYTWVYRIAVNLTLNFLKKKSREKGREELRENSSLMNKGGQFASAPEADSLRRELRRKLDEAVERLPLAFRTSFELVVIQGLSHGQAARALGVSENTVSWRMHKARKMLQARLKDFLEGAE
jgi:RNA polymerase sigma-70 factor (ECF subfamily)